MKLLRIGFANFRSIGSEPVILDLTKRVNLLIGANNSGKSNVIQAFQLLGERLKADKNIPNVRLSGTDLHRRDPDKDFNLTFDCEPTSEVELPAGGGRFRLALGQGGMTWIETPFDQLQWREYTPFLSKWQGSHWTREPSEESLTKTKQEGALIALGKIPEAIPILHLIPQFRQIVDGKYALGGAGIIQLLGKWKSPEIGHDEDRQKFERVEAFLHELLEMPDIALDVPQTNPALIVERGRLRLPLENYGTGIHQLIILAIAVLAKENEFIAIEEPEIHLHPLLQKAFLRFLIDKTSNHYLITTHSQAFLSRPEDCHIIHLWLENGVTHNRHVETSAHTLEVLHDLGIQAADLLQSNFVIWVEGPSDRIYLNRWLELAAPELRETIDYSIMFYGGRLLAHLSMVREEDELSEDELIRLLRINQHSAILIDSDRRKKDGPINATKTRIAEECRRDGVFCWVTAGREVENYLPEEAVALAYEALTGTRRKIGVKIFQKFEDVVEKAHGSHWRSAFAYETRKPQLARSIVPHILSLDFPLDLKAQIEELVRRIRHSERINRAALATT